METNPYTMKNVFDKILSMSNIKYDPNVFWVPYGGQVTREEFEAYGILGTLDKLFVDKMSNKEWAPVIRAAIKELGAYHDTSDTYHLAEAYYEDPQRFPELHNLVLSII